MRVAVVHNLVSESDSPDERDVLVQAETVSSALEDGGHESLMLACSLDLDGIKARLEEVRPDMVFNLVESLNGQCRLLHLFPALLDSLQIPYTGSPTATLWITTHKLMAKERMALAGLPTPDWIGPYPPDLPTLCADRNFNEDVAQRTWIVKSLWEHASFGLDDAGLLSGVDRQKVETVLKKQAARLAGACFAEAYIEGREFNLSLLGGSEGAVLLPPAEIVFDDFQEDMPRIVGYRAKWMPDSFEYHHTPRRFDFAAHDRSLLESLGRIAMRCWDLFGLCGYARVDFRVDAQGRPWILEVNTNPCLSPDAGFAAALERAGITFPQAVERILADGFRRK
jgi:D-alanine-D-alanine ligase